VSRGPVDLQLAGIAAVTNGGAGLQIGGIAALARGPSLFQVAGIAAASNGTSSFQIGGIAAVANGSSNVQLGGIAAATNGSANLQIGGIAAVANGSSNTQVGGIAAATRGSANLQIGGIAAVAQDANVQVAGIVNVARRVRGMQIAPINVARRVEGVQVGVVNVGGSADGFSFGLLNIVPGGRADLEGTLDSSKIGTLLFRHGGNRWHNVYGIAGHPVNEAAPKDDDLWMYGLGFGPSWKLRHARIDVEAMGWQVNQGTSHATNVSVLGQLRMTAAYGIGRFAIVGGAALNAYVSSDHNSPFLTERRIPGEEMDEKYTVEVWPSFFAGLRL
jgi:hypothetical protein